MSEKRVHRDAKAILDRFVAGYHEYILDSPAHLSYASQNLCGMLGYSDEELVSVTADFYEPLVHPADCGRYRDFLASLAEKEGTQTLEYRIVKKNGEIRQVADTMVSRRRKDGVMEGISTLADITDIRAEENIRFINDTVPCGMLRYTCEKTPRVTYANQKMVEIMRVQEGADEVIGQEELYRSNVYLAIAAESRNLFAQVLQKVFLKGAPVAGELTVIRGDGSTGRLFGWVTKCRNAEGQEEFQSICIDITERYLRKRREQADRYLRALSGIYDMIFEFDRSKRTVRYLHGNVSYLSEYLEGLPLMLEQATERWLDNAVAEEDRGRLRRFLLAHILREKSAGQGGPPQIRIRVRKEGENFADHQAIILQAESNTFYFCCRELQPDRETSLLRRQNDTLISQNEEMQELVRRFTDGIVAFEVIGGRVKPLYFSENASAFFGFSKESWGDLAANRRTIREFVAGTGVDYARFEELFARGEAEFSYLDTATGEMHRVKAVCSTLENNPGEAKYVMLYRADGESVRTEEDTAEPHVQIRTFGYFDVFVDGRPIMFKSEKAKELLAILVDRRGGYVTPDEAIALLWEDEPASAVVLARYRKVALRLKNLLEEYGVPEIVESVSGRRRLVPETVECDLYQYLSGDDGCEGLFHGSYLTNYSWAETTLGELIDQSGA